jgi:hypothetical protein
LKITRWEVQDFKFRKSEFQVRVGRLELRLGMGFKGGGGFKLGLGFGFEVRGDRSEK